MVKLCTFVHNGSLSDGTSWEQAAHDHILALTIVIVFTAWSAYEVPSRFQFMPLGNCLASDSVSRHCLSKMDEILTRTSHCVPSALGSCRWLRGRTSILSGILPRSSRDRVAMDRWSRILQAQLDKLLEAC